MGYKYIAEILNEDEEEIVHISALSVESLIEEMGKSKWTQAIKNYEGNLELQREDAEKEIEQEHSIEAELDAAKDREF